MTQLVFRAVLDALDRGEGSALVTVVATGGSTPQRVGAKMAVFADGRTVGTIGGGRDEHDATERAREAIRLRQATVIRYNLSNESAADTGSICGGHMEVFIEPIEPAARLFLIGAGHVAQALARAAAGAGFRLHVVDDRAEFADRSLYPDGTEVHVEAIPDWLGSQPLPPGAFVVIVTRGHRQDLDALRIVAPQPMAYVGMIGSRRKVAQVLGTLRSEGMPAAVLDAVHAPIGLDIGAVTPAEIAVSILAELIAVRSGRIAALHVRHATLRAVQAQGEGRV